MIQNLITSVLDDLEQMSHLCCRVFISLNSNANGGTLAELYKVKK